MFWDCGYNLQEESSAWIQATVSTEASTSLRIFLFFESFSNSSSLRSRATIHRNSAWTEMLLHFPLPVFFFWVCCHLHNNDDVTQRGQPVPRLHQLATYVYMEFVQSLATLQKKKCSSQKHPRQVPLRHSGHSVSLGRANATYLSSSF